MTQLPAVIISGFLGAGKTTLLNHVLAHGLSGRKAGVIVNDFGRLNVDGRLVRGGDHPLLALSNGCVCCTLQPGLERALRALAGRGELDLLLVEASGISVTSALLSTLKSAELAELVRVVRVVAVIDARGYSQALHALPVIRDQVAHADLIVLNHCDEVDAATIDASGDRLRQQNPGAPVLVTQQAAIGADILFADATHPPANVHRAGHDLDWHAYEVVLTGAHEPARVAALVDQLPDAVERVKGIVSHGDELHVLQKVGPFPASLERWHGARGDGDGDACDRLVVIARRPIHEQLEETFRGCAIVASTNASTRPAGV